MGIKLYNTPKRAREDFEPLTVGAVHMYNCGPTVYNFAHIGNMRAYLMGDLLRRTLEWNGYVVKQVINITDVGHLVSDADAGEDKMELAVRREHKSAQEIAQFYEDQFHQDLAALNIETSGTLFPKATEHIAEQIELIKILESKGSAYKTSDGIYFDISTFPSYADFAHLDLSHQKEGARVEANNEKRNSEDFALWKFSASDEKREQEWDSPWGIGFPGWHIECSAMSMKYLGETLDIHTGGIDHIPVHHTNEIAQSEAATSMPFVRYWLHSAFMTVDGEKMSKSLGNTFTVSELSAHSIHPVAYRYWLLTAHYRTQVNFTWEAVGAAQTALERLLVEYGLAKFSVGFVAGHVDAQYKQQFEDLINDDLNMPQALALFGEVARSQDLSNENKVATMLAFDDVLGIGIDGLHQALSEEIPQDVQDLRDQREIARVEKRYKDADDIRLMLEAKGFVLHDFPDRTLIERSFKSLLG